MVNHRLSSSSSEDESSCRKCSTSSTWTRYGCHCGTVRWRPATSSTTSSFLSFLLLLVSVEALSLASVTTATRMHYIHWNTTNPIFRIDNTDHIIDVNKNNIPFEYDQVNIICPVYTPGTHEDDAEKYIIYNVSKEEYDTCRITNPNPRIIAVCDKPYKLMYFTITFRSFTPQPGGLEFRPGQDYYFISTSSKDDLHRRIGGRCSSHNMKVVFKVCCKAEDMDKGTTVGRPALPSTTTSTTMATHLVSSATHSPAVLASSNNGSRQVAASAAATTPAAVPAQAAAVIPARSSSSSTTSSTTVTPLMVPSVTDRPRMPPHWKDMMDVREYSIRTTTKKYGKYDFDKLSNEVVKNEELTSKSSSGMRRHHCSSSSLLLTLVAAAAASTTLFRVR